MHNNSVFLSVAFSVCCFESRRGNLVVTSAEFHPGSWALLLLDRMFLTFMLSVLLWQGVFTCEIKSEVRTLK